MAQSIHKEEKAEEASFGKAVSTDDKVKQDKPAKKVEAAPEPVQEKDDPQVDNLLTNKHKDLSVKSPLEEAESD
jgi:hypothetical protein